MVPGRFLVVGLNPTIQNTYTFPSLRLSQVNRVATHRVDVAGKGGNPTRVLVQLGEPAVHLTFGGGRNLDLYRDLCRRDELPLRLVESDVEIRFCHTLIAEDERTTTEIVEPGSTVSSSVERAVLEAFAEELADAHTVVIGGSHAPGFSTDLYRRMVEMASGAGARTVLDIRGEELLGCLRHTPTVLKINLSEFSHTFTPESALDEDVAPEDIPDEVRDRMISLRAETGTEVVITNGRHPALFVDGGEVTAVAPPKVTPVNTVGSGDAATAGLAAGLHRGLSLGESVRLALDCAARNVVLLKPGSIL